MIKILTVINKRRDIKIENIINTELKENDIWDNQIINIQTIGNDKATIIYKE